MILGTFGGDHGATQWTGAAILIVLLLIWTRVCQRLERLPVNAGTAFSRGSIPRALLGLAVAVPLCGLSLVSLQWLVPGVAFVYRPTATEPLLASVGLYLLLAAYEEIGFRGYPLARLLPSFGIWPTLLLIAPMFVCYHLSLGWPVVQAAIGTGVASLLFGMAAIAARQGLAFPIGVHAGWNFVTWCLTSGSGPWKMTVPAQSANRVQAIATVVYVVCMLFGTTLLWLWTRRAGYLNRPKAGPDAV